MLAMSKLHHTKITLYVLPARRKNKCSFLNESILSMNWKFLNKKLQQALNKNYT